MRALRPLLVATVALACSSVRSGAFAQPAPEPIRLRWSAPEGCPDTAAVEARVERLLGGPPAATDRTLEATGTVERVARGLRLDLEIAAAGASSTRVLQSVACESLADAAALVIALAFDPEAVTAQEIKRAEAAAGEPATGEPGGTAPPGGEHDHAGPVSTATLVRIPIRFPVSPPPAPPPPPVRSAVSFGAFASFAGDAGSLPQVAPGLRVGVALGIGAFRVAPAFEAWPAARSALASRPSAGVEMRLFTFALDACRRVWPWSDERGGWAALGCLGFEIGELRGQGFGVTVPDSGSVLWAAPRAALRAHIALAEWAALTIDLGAAIPVDRSRFVLDLRSGRTVAHEPSPASGRLGAGLEVCY